jgi:hypothetical protein
MFLVCGAATARTGALFGVVIEALDTGGANQTLLIRVGERGDPPVSDVRIDLGKKSARDAEAALMPSGWQAESDGGTFSLNGPPADPPLFLRVEPGSAVAVPGTVGVRVYSNGDRVFKDSVPVADRGLPVTNPDDIGSVIILPPVLVPGETVTTTVTDPGRAPRGGRWSLGDADGQTSETRGTGDDGYTVTFPVPGELHPGGPIDLVYVDPWGETALDTEVSSDVNLAPAGEKDDPPRIDSSQRYVFIGMTGCVCGHFPTAESQRGLEIGGMPIGEPLAASSSVVVFRLPEGITPGRHRVTGNPELGFPPNIDVEIVALQLSGSIDQELLMRGQSTPMHIEIEGTDEPLELLLTNTTPAVISLEGGDEGVVMTSGGEPNTVERIVHGRTRGDFHITYTMANDPCPCGPEGADTITMPGDGSPVQTGYRVPPGVTIGTPVSTGRTTGTIAEVEVRNDGTEPIVFPEGAVLIHSSDEHQGYIVPGGRGTTVQPGETVTVPLDGYCTDVRKPPVPSGESLPDPTEWTVPTDPTSPFPAPGDPDFYDEDVEVRIIGGVEAITRTTEELQESGELKTPFSSNPERERETVIQQTTWRYTSELEGRPYTREEFDDRLEEQYEERTGTPIEEAPEEDRVRLEEGADDFWDAFELVGENAKVLEPEEEMPSTTQESVPITTGEPPCDIDRPMKHSEADSDFKMSESYKDEAKRTSLREWFGDLPEVADTTEGGTFETSKYPASAWAVAGRDFIGGYCNAVAKHIYAESGGGTDWVWSTEKLEVEAKSNGIHNLTIRPPAEGCETLVVGAGGGVVEAWSNAVDPIAHNRNLIEVLRYVVAVSVSVATAPLSIPASVVAGVATLVATEAFNSEFSSDANAVAAAQGQIEILAGRRRQLFDATSRSEVDDDGKIESDSALTGMGETSDSNPLSLTVNTSGLVALRTWASGNGVAEGTVESQIGVAIVGFCRCGGGVQVKFLTDSGLFLVEKGAAAAATTTAERLEELVGATVDRYLELPAEEVIPKAREDLATDLEALLREWALENGNGEGGTGYFDTTPRDAGGG